MVVNSAFQAEPPTAAGPKQYGVAEKSDDRRRRTVTLYRPTGAKELQLVKESGFRRWPPRLPDQPIFYPVTNEEYAREITARWNVRDGGVGYVTRFRVEKRFMDRFEVQRVGAAQHTEWWIPAEQLEELNDHIVGVIEVIGEHREEA